MTEITQAGSTGRIEPVPEEVRLRYSSRTDVGLVREHNEDSLVALPPLFAVCDGMGGHEAGEVASRIAVETLVHDAPDHADGEALGQAIVNANEAVIAGARKGDGRPGMGTTCTACIIDGNQLVVGHVGDSRCYLLRGNELMQLTQDHSLVADLVRQGRLTPEEARIHPQRSVITRALGSDPDMIPDVYHYTLEPHDRLLVNSDGLSSMISDADIAQLLAAHPDVDECAEALIDAALEAGGHDNVTVVVIDLPATLPAPASDVAADDQESSTSRIRPVQAVAPLTDATEADAAEARQAAGEDADSESGADPSTTSPIAVGAPTQEELAAADDARSPESDASTDAPTSGNEDSMQIAKGTRAARREARRRHERPSKATRRRRVAIIAFVIALVAAIGLAGGGTYAYARHVAFLQTDDRGYVAVYQGFPDDIAGISLRWYVKSTDIKASELSESVSERLQTGVKVDSLEEADQLVEDYRNQITERQEAEHRAAIASGEGSESAGPSGTEEAPSEEGAPAPDGTYEAAAADSYGSYY